MSRKEESTTSQNSPPTTGLEPRWMRRAMGCHYGGITATKPRKSVAVSALGLPVMAAAGGTEGGVPDPSMGSLLDVLGNVAAHWPMGGYPGFGLTIVASAGLGYYHLKQKWAGTGPTSTPKASREIGFANTNELRALSGATLRKRAAVLRPSLADVKRREISPHALGLYLGTDLIHKRGLFMSCEDTVLIIAPPRSGKSAQLGNAVIDAAGFCVVTSTRGDLYEHTHNKRREENRPVWVFNSDVAGVANSMRWNLVEGCQDPETAVRRAGFILAASASGGDMENATFWNSHSFRVLRSYLMLAALEGGDLLTVRAWVNNPDGKDGRRALEDHADRLPEGWFQDLDQQLKSPERTRASIFLTLVKSFEFLALPQVAEIVRPRPGEQRFDVVDFIRSRGTLYLMGRDRPYGSIAPLFNCLVGEIHAVASLMADNNGGRLDPYGRFVLDEAAIICPLPLHQWTADSGGRNLQLLISVQSISQLKERWGQWGAQTIWTNSSKMVLGGLSVAQDLDELSMLCGERDEEVASNSTTADGEKESRNLSVRRVRVMPPDQIRGMKEGTGLFFHRALPPVRYAFTAVWDRKDIKQLKKAEAKQAKAHKRAAKTKGFDADAWHGVDFPAQGLDAPPMPSTAPVVAEQPGHGIPAQPPAAEDRRWTA
ncbi:type IV secretory system conjugative DNA transfer family protein [Streptomyces sp. NPDC005408]|uniref:type IV secretory system conjugative DNA transfer family protein n=1 Tax=Streptomyces sp. NPDC005408 TaxID=3155341 RepID=UPI0033A3F3F7